MSSNDFGVNFVQRGLPATPICAPATAIADPGRERIAGARAELDAMVAGAKKFLCPQAGGSPCTDPHCLHEAWTSAELNNALADLIYGAYLLFRHEVDAMRWQASAEHLRRHVEEHGDLMDALTGHGARRPLPADAEVAAAINRFCERYRRHAQTTDAEMTASLYPVRPRA